MGTEKQIIKIGEIGVDSGLVYVGDPCYVWEEDGVARKQIGDWDQFCNTLDNVPYPQHHAFGILGVVATSGLGDGRYPVYATIEDWVITSMTVKFLEEDDEGEEIDDDELLNERHDTQRKAREQIQTVRGAIIGALAGGHIDGHDGASYSKSVLRQIADLLDIELPESVR